MTDSPEIYNSSELGEEEPSTVKEQKSYSRIECVYSVLTLIIGYGLIRFVIYNTSGIFSTVIFAALTTAVIIFMKKSVSTFTRHSKITAAILYIFSTVFFITDNSLIKGLTAVFLIIGIGYFVYSSSGNKTEVERFLFFALIKSVFEHPSKSMHEEFGALNASVKSSRFAGGFKMVIMGLLSAVPLTVIVALLLMSADDGVASMLEGAGNFIFEENIWMVIWQLVLTIPCACYLFGMLYSGIHQEKLHLLNNDECESTLNGARFAPGMAVCSAVTPICILYVLFFISQGAYFLSAFSGELPSGYIYSDYARKGFFELFAISIINLAVIIIINTISKKNEKGKPLGVKFYSITLCLFTLVMIAVAISKMVMYISVYGLTRLRVYTMWFMALEIFLFILIIIKQFKADFKIAKWGTLFFTLMFAALCFSRPDALIVKYNISMYNSGYLEEFDTSTIFKMSDDAVLEALQSGTITEDDIDKNHIPSNDRYNISSILLK